ncbi:hypothetical protein T11_8829 [Trichinella zimbabwensis]|uniref:Uncharacterized protein n=1 Tax=Trichinella zimbabwensis TaxID=268475 RepID=A0A0V1HY71_9BILA|nr:hypothetical protein T11_8829 [Trichinella zimbabwensis]
MWIFIIADLLLCKAEQESIEEKEREREKLSSVQINHQIGCKFMRIVKQKMWNICLLRNRLLMCNV